MPEEPRASLLERYVRAGIAPDDDDRLRLRKSSLTLIATLIAGLAPAWIATYLVLGHPTAGAIPAAYIAFTAVGIGVLFVTKRDSVLLTTQVVAIFGLPIALQWVLGGFVQGSAVALWSFSAVLLALVAWGARAATVVFALFVAAIVVSGLVEPYLRGVVPALPDPIQTAFFVLNVVAPLATTFTLLVHLTRERDTAQAASDTLLDNILPASVARLLKTGHREVAERHDEATVAFIDFVSFTEFAERTPPERVVELLGRAFSALDTLAGRHGVEKIKTLGDGYLAAAGVTDRRTDHATAVAEMALAVRAALRLGMGEDWPEFETRIGIATGPVIAGVIGERRLGFDLWGDTVNTASRMASHAEPGTIQVTESTAAALGERYKLERREAVEVKGKGPMTTYLLLAAG